MKILFLSRWFPFPPDNGSKLRVYNLIKIIAKTHNIDLISFASEPILEERERRMHSFCQKVVTVLFKDYNPDSLQSRLGYFSPKPRYIVDTYRKEFEKAVQSACQKKKYDLAIASQVDMTPYIKAVKGVKVMIDEIELMVHHEAYSKQSNGWQKLRRNLTWWKHSNYIKGVLKRVNGISVVSMREMELVEGLDRSQCLRKVIPNGIDMDYYQGDWGKPEPDTMIYAGALSYSANLDAVNYFISEILPLVKEQRPRARLLVTGKIDDSIRASIPANPNVEFTGYLEDVRPRVGSAWLSVIPLRVGGGTRLKILESLAMGTPVISTSKGAEGLNLKSGRDIIIRDNPEEFADEVVKLLGSRELRSRLGLSGQQTVGSLYNWKIIGDKFLALLDEIACEK